MLIYLLREAYAQLLAVAGLIVLSVFGIHNIAGMTKKRVYKVLLWILGLTAIILSTSIIVDTTYLAPR